MMVLLVKVLGYGGVFSDRNGNSSGNEVSGGGGNGDGSVSDNDRNSSEEMMIAICLQDKNIFL